MEFVAVAPRPFEDLLEGELSELGLAPDSRHGTSLRFAGDLVDAYRVLMYSRIASRLTLILAEGALAVADDVYALARQVPWHEHLTPAQTFSVSFRGVGAGIRNTQFGARRVKDAVVDHFRDRDDERPSVDTQDPDLVIHTRIARGAVEVGIELAGGGLHRRGYRAKGILAPLKENVAAGILMRAGFSGDEALVDPMCGSGTLLIEGALIAGDIAPGLLRPAAKLESWLGHDRHGWTSLRDEARSRRRDPAHSFEGVDVSPSAVRAAIASLERAGLSDRIRIRALDARSLERSADAGLVVSNLPYGERLERAGPQLRELYRTFGAHLSREFSGFRFALLVPSDGTSHHLPLSVDKKNSVLNGRIECWLVQGALGGESATDRTETRSAIANRLRKNRQRLKKWVKRENIQAYRLYDADIPEYAVAIDLYRDWVHVQEYAPPSSVERVRAEERLDDVMSVLPEVLDVPPERVVLKVRERKRGTRQYEKRDTRRERIEIVEGDVRLLVNLHDYLDTGLFLDHRPTRLRLASECKGRRFLNLFCYTAAASVHAAVGGARRTVSVDLSNTYLDWAEDNLRNNGLEVGRSNVLVRADVMKYLARTDETFDVIFCDPPTFSNSKSTEQVFDVQRDHEALIRAAMSRLDPDGLLIFSTNRRRFRLSEPLRDAFSVTEVDSIPEDFARNRRIHSAYDVRRRPE
ncbi:MAG: bifunctional 23S rRNA (guanine(2069)-N(7))-methyltransferase RlmK/23S rRNA (guanine(2445)-N(2))-methyltransferase RlmL [Myxococcota bacterium]